MKRAFSLVISFCLFIAAQAQTKAQEKIIAKVSDEVCECMQKSNPDTVKTRNQFQGLMLQCLAKPMLAHLDELTKAYDIKRMDRESGRMIGEEVGKKMAVSCPVFTELAIRIAGTEELTEEVPPPPQEVESPSLTGELLRTETDGFVYFILKDNMSREVRFLWLDFFVGSDPLTSDPSKYNGKRVRISWKEMEVYLPAAKGYYKVKVITKLELL